MAIRVVNSILTDKIHIGDIREEGTAWIDEFENFGIFIDDTHYILYDDHFERYEYHFSNYAELGATLVDIEITIKAKEY